MEPNRKPRTAPNDGGFAYYPVQVGQRNDEIPLVDLWLVLVRRKAVFFAVAGLVLAAGLAYAMLASPKYRYWSLVELGSTPTATGSEAVESVSTVLAKVNGAFLPAALADYLKTQPEGTQPPKVRVNIPKGSETLMLEADGPVDEGPTLTGIQQAVIARITQDHADVVAAERQAVRINITAGKNELATLQANGRGLQAQVKRTEELAADLRARRSEIQQALDVAIGLEQDLLSTPEAQRDTAALLQANVESRALRDQLLSLDERLSTALPKQIDDLGAAVDANAREITAQQERIANLESRLSLIRETRAIQPPTRAIEKSGPGRTVIVVLAGMLGLFLGMLSAFAAEFMSEVRRELAETGAEATADDGLHSRAN